MALPLPYPLNAPLIALYGLALGLLLDTLYPYHKGLLLRIHPVHTCYVMARRLYKPFASKAYGVLEALVCLAAHLAPVVALALVLLRVPPEGVWLFLGVVIVGIVVKFSIGFRLLLQTVLGAAYGGEAEARRLIQGIVRRNVYELDLAHVYSAGLESLAESLVDGYTSPLTWFFLLGIIGAMLQRLANTLDGALGLLDADIKDQGWFSARLDTIINYLPARLTALSILLAGLAMKNDVRKAWRLYREYSGATSSLNAGHPMSALAGVLGVSLEKPGYYRVGRGPLPSRRHLEEGVRIIVVSAIVYTFFASLLYLSLTLLFLP
ncbi:MAG: cobalamin biosynthesis protein [Desulfurococcales archaeon]|nr:cobalamin biosynthesis protein [Desulfurococcales archaeon]